MIIYLRHGSDEGEDPTFAHDQKVVMTKENQEDITKVGKFLVAKYGTPDMIVCSPFKRAKDTFDIMKKTGVIAPDYKLFVDTRVGRYFSSKEKNAGPEVRQETLEMGAKVYDPWDKFKERVYRHVDQVTADGFTKSRHKIMWVITHTLVIKEVAKYLNFEMPEYYEFLQWVCLRSHGPRYPISFMAIGNGAVDPKVLQIDKNREDSHVRRAERGADRREGEKKVPSKAKGNVPPKKKHKTSPQKNEKGKRKESDSDDDDGNDDSGFIDDVSVDSDYDDDGNITAVYEMDDSDNDDEPKKKTKRPRKEAVKEPPKKSKSKHKAVERPKVFTIDDHVDVIEHQKMAEEKYKNRLRGRPLDEHINEHIKQQPQFRIVKDKYEKAKGGNLDDFVSAFNSAKPSTSAKPDTSARLTINNRLPPAAKSAK